MRRWGAHADSILSEVGALALVTQGQRIQGAALISALRTDGDAVVPMHGPALIGAVDGAWRRQGGGEMFELPHIVRALRQIVGRKGEGMEFMGAPLVLALPGDGAQDDGGESASKKVGGTPEVGLQMQDSSKYDLLSNFGPREMAAAQSTERVGTSRMVTFSVMGTSKGASKVHLMVYAPPDQGVRGPKRVYPGDLREAGGQIA